MKIKMAMEIPHPRVISNESQYCVSQGIIFGRSNSLSISLYRPIQIILTFRRRAIRISLVNYPKIMTMQMKWMLAPIINNDYINDFIVVDFKGISMVG